MTIIKKTLLHVLAFTLVFSFVTLAYGNDAMVPNPLSTDFNSVPKFIAGALKVMVMVALPIVTLFFVYSGFLFVKAQGNTSKLSEAKQNFVYVVIGAILILGAWVIATLIGGTVTQLLPN